MKIRMSLLSLLLVPLGCGERAPEPVAPAAPQSESSEAAPESPRPASDTRPEGEPGEHEHGRAHGHDHGHGHTREDGHEHGDEQAGGEHDYSAKVVGHRFDDADKWAKRFDDPSRDAWQKPDHVVELMGIDSGMTVADIGAGTGYFVPHLSAAVGDAGRVLALDIEPEMISYLKERAEREGLDNVEARVVAPDDPDLGAAEVDRAIIVNTWHHIADRAGYAAVLADGLVPGGRVYIVDFTLETSKGPPRSHRLEPDEVVADLEAGGLRARVVEETLPDQYVVVGIRPGS